MEWWVPWFIRIGTVIGVLFLPVALLWHLVWKDRVIDRWIVYRLRVARRTKRGRSSASWGRGVGPPGGFASEHDTSPLPAPQIPDSDSY